MAFNTGKKKGAISDINVTPLVDVMLVLLIIFMVTAPLMLNGIKLDLPKTREVNPINLSATQVILSLSKSEDYFLGKDRILANEIIPEIKKQFKSNKTETLFLRADFNLPYGKVARLMSFLKRGGIHSISLVTVTEDKE
jgi:biopolymer transport protein TolR